MQELEQSATRELSELPFDAPSRSSALWLETALLTLAGGTFILLTTQPAFHSFFLGEDFIYLGQYVYHGNNFFRAVLSPTDHIFFRPTFCAINLLWQFIIPLDPLIHHWRNFAFTLVNLALLYRVLVRLVASRWARFTGTAFFALSKVHFTAIGYINVYDSIVSLMFLLLTVLFFLRYIDQRRIYDYALGLLFCFLSIFTKDYGLVVVGIVIVLVIFHGMDRQHWRSQTRWWLHRLSPLVAMVVFYLGLRYMIVGPLPTSYPAYNPTLSVDATIWKIVVFTSTMGNLSLSRPGTTGGDGWGALVAATERSHFGWQVPSINSPRFDLHANAVDALFYLGLMALILVTFSIGQRKWPRLIFPLVWIAAYFGPTLLTRNLQMYYMYEPLAGMAVLLGVCLDSANRRVLNAWAMALVLIGANGAIANSQSSYDWQFAANLVQRVQKPVIQAYQGRRLRSITFLTGQEPFWQWALTADFLGPMIPELMKLPNLQVHFIDYKSLVEHPIKTDNADLVLNVDENFAPYDAAQLRRPLVLRSIRPAGATAGVLFNVQPDGQSAIAVTAERAIPGTVIVMGDTPLLTTFSDPQHLTALVPARLLSRPTHYQVYLKDELGQSNSVDFLVSAPRAAPSIASPAVTRPPSSAPGLSLLRLYPSSTRVGVGFNVQPNGQSALAVDCEYAVPGTVIIFDNTPLATSFGNSQQLSAIVPASLFSQPGRHEIYLKNGAAESARLPFVVEP